MRLDSRGRGLPWCNRMRSCLLAVLTTCVLLAGCGQSSLTTDDLIQRLTAQGVKTQVLGPTYAPLNIRGTRVHISGSSLSEPAELQVYEDTAHQVQIEHGTIVSQTQADSNLWLNRGGPVRAPDNSPSSTAARTTVIDVAHWPYPMHVFQHERLIVLYVGDDQAVLDLLTDILGRPVAGP